MNKCAAVILAALVLPSTSQAEWAKGTVNLATTWPDKIYVRWTGSNLGKCKSNTVFFDQKTLGGKEDELTKGLSVAISAAGSGKPVRFQLDGCAGPFQKATGIEACGDKNCKT